jgi:hypothetical protein
MAILESQLSTWAHQGSIINSASTYDSIKNCIDAINWNDDVNYEIYLQGSYRNSTNIYGNSDVDIVVEFTSIFSSDTSLLDDVGKATHNALADGKYALSSFKKSIVTSLESNYKNSVIVGPKAIKITGGTSRLNADVVVCNTYKKYLNNNGSRFLSAVKGITFLNSDTVERITNYPKLHFDHGVAKNENSRTSGNYKSTVRIFRNIKAYLVTNNAINAQTAPSYFVECLIYNAKDSCFKESSYQLRIYRILKQLTEDIDDNSILDYVCQNEQLKLFGTTKQQWNLNDAKIFINAILELWKS